MTIGQPLFGHGIRNLNKNMAEIKNIIPKDKLGSDNLNKKINLIKNKLFIYSLAN